jgi:hypothetical protein
MSVSMADTAELPRVSPPAMAPVSAETSPTMPEWLEVGAAHAPADAAARPALSVVCDLPAPPRAMLRVERRRERRQRMWWATVGLSAMVALLGLTVAVLSMVR